MYDYYYYSQTNTKNKKAIIIECHYHRDKQHTHADLPILRQSEDEINPKIHERVEFVGHPEQHDLFSCRAITSRHTGTSINTPASQFATRGGWVDFADSQTNVTSIHTLGEYTSVRFAG